MVKKMKFIKLALVALTSLTLLAGCGGGSSAVETAQPISSSSIVRNEETCQVEINKTCLVYTPVALFAADKCDGKLKQFTVVWEGPDGVTISGLPNDTNNDLVNDGDEVTFIGPFSQNDVVATINLNGSRYGESVFHMSCSDENFNSADDCNKLAGNGKSDDNAYKNEWSLEGFVDDSDQVLDCSPATADTIPVASSCDVSDMPGMDCETLGKPTAISFRYNVATECNSSANNQGSTAECTDSGTLNGPVTISLLANADDFQLSTTSLNDGESVDITPTGDKLPSRIELQLNDGNSSQTLNIHLSCSVPLAVGDVFGALELTALNGQDGSIDVIYGYEVTNTNTSPLFNLSILDSNDSVIFDAPDSSDPLFNPAQPFDLDQGETAKFTSSASVLIGSSSNAIVEDFDTGTQCGTSNDVPVNKIEPGCMLSLELYKIEDYKIKYKIFNDGDQDETLSDITFAWPGDGLLKKIKFDGNEIIKDVALASPVSLDQFLKETEDRLLKAGDDTKIEFEFTQKFPLKKEQPLEDFNYSFGFGDGLDCRLSNGGNVTEIVWLDKNFNGIPDFNTGEPQTTEELSNVEVTFSINGVDSVLFTDDSGAATINGLEDGALVTITIDDPYPNSIVQGTNPTSINIIAGETVTDMTGYQEAI
jgi:hypothetical protein